MSSSKTLALTTLMLCVGARWAWGQVIDKKTISLEGAKAVAAAAASEARRNNEGGSIAVVDDGGNLVYLERLEPTFPASAEIAIRKARTAALFQRPSKVLEDAITSGRTSLLKVADAPLQGGEPIRVSGVIVGAIGVSGANSAQQDEELALAGAAAVTGAGATASITYLRGAEVAEAFVKGRPLVEVANYKVHASHRDGAGKAEVHLRDTDIIHVLHGKATMPDSNSFDTNRMGCSSPLNGCRSQWQAPLRPRGRWPGRARRSPRR